MAKKEKAAPVKKAAPLVEVELLAKYSGRYGKHAAGARISVSGGDAEQLIRGGYAQIPLGDRAPAPAQDPVSE